MDSLYIHIPFCLKKCSYCDFLSIPYSLIDKGLYCNALTKELQLYKKQFFDTIYFGGGTPSLLEPHEIQSLFSNLDFNETSEITIEMNPKTADLEKLISYIDIGINRISIGCQSFDPSILKVLGRVHSAQESEEAYYLAREAGFKNINLDLMFGIPGQTIEMLKADLEKITKLSPEHISIYSLIWEEGTPFYSKLEKGVLSPVSEDLEADMYEIIIDFLKKSGYTHYEISNFAKKGFESRHNKKYWHNQEYRAIGLGASGYENNIRYQNTSNFDEYYKKLESNAIPVKEKEFLLDKDKFEYYLILGLRLIEEGVTIENYSDWRKIYRQRADFLTSKGMLIQNENKFKLSEKGLFLANNVFSEFLI